MPRENEANQPIVGQNPRCSAQIFSPHAHHLLPTSEHFDRVNRYEPHDRYKPAAVGQIDSPSAIAAHMGKIRTRLPPGT